MNTYIITYIHTFMHTCAFSHLEISLVLHSSSALVSRMCNDRVKRRKKTLSVDEFMAVTAHGFVV